MRFSELGLLKYGRFDDVTLPFRSGKPDMHIIYGPNEAGKSTTLEAVSDFLFGFPHVTPYGFKFDLKLLRIKATVENDGTTLQCIRKRGNKGTLLDNSEQPIDEGQLAGLLHGLDRGAYRLGWSLDHLRLRDGGQAMIDAKDDIGQALFTAGAGLASVSSILSAIDDDAERIWTRQSRDRLFARAFRLYEEARARMRAAQTRPAAWEAARKELSDLESALAAKRNERSDAQARLSVLERTRRILAPIGKYQGAQAHLAALGEPLPFPPDAAELLRIAEATIASCDLSLKTSAARFASIEAALAQVDDHQVLLSISDDIDALADTKGAYSKELEDMPKRAADLNHKTARMLDLARELGWTQATPEEISARLPARGQVEEIRSMIESKAVLDARISASSAALATAKRLVVETDRALALLPESSPIEVVEAALRAASKAGDVGSELATRKVTLETNSAALNIAIAQLGDWTIAGATTLDAVRIPSEETIRRIQKQHDSQTGAIEDTGREQARALDTAVALALRRTSLTSSGLVVSESALRDARAARDRALDTIRVAVVDGPPLTSASSAFSGHQLLVEQSDTLADRRYAAADEAAQLTAVQLEIEDNELRTRQLEARRLSSVAALAATQSAWQEALLAGQAPPIPLGEARDWSTKHQAALTLRTAHAATMERVSQQEALIRQLEVDLRVALAVSGAELNLTTLMAVAEARVADASSLGDERLKLATEAASAANAAATATDEKASLEPLLAEWQAGWSTLLTAATLDVGTAESVRGQLAIVDDLRGIVGEVLDLQHRVSTMQSDVDAFESAVAKIAQPYVTSSHGSPLVVLNNLRDHLAAAKVSSVQMTTLSGQLAEERLASEKLAEERSGAEASIAHLLDLTGQADRTTLSNEISRASSVQVVREDLKKFENEALAAGDALPLHSLLRLVENADVDALKSQTDDVTSAISALNSELDDLGARTGAARQTFESFGQSDAAAQAAADMEEAAAELETLAETWLMKTVQSLLLQRTIEEYRLRKQNPMLKRASELFSRLTLNTYERLSVEYDQESSKLFGVRQNGTEVVPVDGMSDGTVDQLFLALRLAAAEDSIDHGVRVPFLADDLFVNFDDERAAAGLGILSELASKTQVLFFTHHDHLAKIAADRLPADSFTLTRLERRAGGALFEPHQISV